MIYKNRSEARHYCRKNFFFRRLDGVALLFEFFFRLRKYSAHGQDVSHHLLEFRKRERKNSADGRALFKGRDKVLVRDLNQISFFICKAYSGFIYELAHQCRVYSVSILVIYLNFISARSKVIIGFAADSDYRNICGSEIFL